MSKSRTPLECCSIFMTYRYFTLLESIHTLAIDTIYGGLPLDSFKHLDPCTSVEIDVKIKDILRYFFLLKNHLYVNNSECCGEAVQATMAHLGNHQCVVSMRQKMHPVRCNKIPQ